MAETSVENETSACANPVMTADWSMGAAGTRMRLTVPVPVFPALSVAMTVNALEPATRPETVFDQVCPDTVAGEAFTVTLTTVPESVADPVRNAVEPVTF